MVSGYDFTRNWLAKCWFSHNDLPMPKIYYHKYQQWRYDMLSSRVPFKGVHWLGSCHWASLPTFCVFFSICIVIIVFPSYEQNATHHSTYGHYKVVLGFACEKLNCTMSTEILQLQNENYAFVVCTNVGLRKAWQLTEVLHLQGT